MTEGNIDVKTEVSDDADTGATEGTPEDTGVRAGAVVGAAADADVAPSAGEGITAVELAGV